MPTLVASWSVNLAPFELEVWLEQRQSACHWDFSSTGMGTVSWAQLLTWAEVPPDLAMIKLGYGELSGSCGLRTAIGQRYLNCDPEFILVTQGAIEANLLVMSALLEPLDKVIIITPSYQQFEAWPNFLSAEVIPWSLSKKNLFDDQTLAPDLAFLNQFRQQLPKLIILNHPHNPTGKCFDPQWLQAVLDWAEQHGVWVLGDEVYRDLQPLYLPPSLADQRGERVVVTNSLAKSVGLPGLRIGWIHGNPDLLQQCRRIKDYFTISPAQPAATLAQWLLEHWETLWPQQHAKYLMARNSCLELLQPVFPELRLAHLQGGAMAWVPCPEADQFAALLLTNYGALVVPGSCFGQDAGLRIGFGNLHHGAWQQILGEIIKAYSPNNKVKNSSSRNLPPLSP